MDRFEVCVYNAVSFIWKIYIPVWIDLKPESQIGNTNDIFIYIPVWIDLKVSDVAVSAVASSFTFQYG